MLDTTPTAVKGALAVLPTEVGDRDTTVEIHKG